MPRHSLENLATVPVEEGGLRPELRPLGRPDALAVVAQQGLLEAGRAVGQVGDEQHALRAEGEGAQVEGLVVQHAQGQPVALPVGAADLTLAQGMSARRKLRRPRGG